MKTLFTVATFVLSQLAVAQATVENPWARATVEGMTMGGVFGKITNHGKTDDFLIGGSSPIAKKVEIHNHINDNGIMRMREVKGGIPLMQGKALELKPGSYHIMLMGLKTPLKQGDKFPLTLQFKNTKPQTITVEVKALNQQAQEHHHHHH